MNKNTINNAICYYLDEFRNYVDTDNKLNDTVIGLIRDYFTTEKELADALIELKNRLSWIVEPKRANFPVSKTLSGYQVSMINNLESIEENNEYFIDIKKLIESKLEYMKSNIGKSTDEIQAIDNIVYEITSLYASNIESLAEIIRRKKEYNEALTNYTSQLKFTIMAFVKNLDTNMTVMEMKETRDRKQHFAERKEILLNKITTLLEDAEFHESFRTQTEEDIKLLEEIYASNVDRLYKVKMSYDYLLFDAYDLYNANSIIKTNTTIDDITRDMPDYDTQDFVVQDDVKKTPKTDPKTLSEDKLRTSIERTFKILNSSYASLGKMRELSSNLSSMIETTDKEENGSKSMIKLVMHNGHALEPINK